MYPHMVDDLIARRISHLYALHTCGVTSAETELPVQCWAVQATDGRDLCQGSAGCCRLGAQGCQPRADKGEGLPSLL